MLILKESRSRANFYFKCLSELRWYKYDKQAHKYIFQAPITLYSFRFFQSVCKRRIMSAIFYKLVAFISQSGDLTVLDLTYWPDLLVFSTEFCHPF